MEFYNWLRNCWLFKKDSVAWILLMNLYHLVAPLYFPWLYYDNTYTEGPKTIVLSAPGGDRTTSEML